MRAVVAFLAVLACACGRQPQPQPAGTSTRAAGVARATPAPAPVSPTPVFEVGLAPGEGIPVVEAVRAQLPLRASPSQASRIVATLVVNVGERLTYDSTRFQTVQAAQLRVLDSAVVEGRSLGAIRYLSRDRYYTGAFRDTAIRVRPRTTIEYLQYRAEGTCFVRIDARVIDADPCPVQDSTKFALRDNPKNLWWIYVTTKNATGWLLLTDSTARVVDRTF